MSTFIASVIFTWSLLQSAMSDSYRTDDEKQYQAESINCKDNEKCNITCNKDFGCEGATITCPANDECDIYCGGSGEYPCWNAMINCTDSTVCNLECDSVLACWGMTIYAPENNGTNIACNNTGNLDNVCSGITVYGELKSIDSCKGTGTCWQSKFNGTGSINVCEGTDACLEAILPEPDMDMDYTLVCEGERACKYAEVRCPEKANCTIICDGAYSCEGTKVAPPIAKKPMLICEDPDDEDKDCDELGVILVEREVSGSGSDGKGAGALGALLVIFMIAVCAWLVVSYGIVYKQEQEENEDNVQESYHINPQKN